MIEIKNSFHLSNLIGIKWDLFKELLNTTDDNYHNFNILQKNGKKRKISIPNLELCWCQNFILSNILKNIKISNYAYGFVKNKGHIRNAKVHIGSKYAINVDIKNFFPSINTKRIYYVFNTICGYNSEVATVLTKLCTYKGSLPQGASTSPYLSNIIFYKSDRLLSSLADQYKLKYSRYADDICFSSSNNLPMGILLFIERIVIKSGFSLNQKKTRVYNNITINITGLIIKNNGVYVHKNYIRKIRQELYFIEKYGIDDHIEHLKSKGIYNQNYQDYLLGKISYVYQISKKDGQILYERYNKIFE